MILILQTLFACLATGLGFFLAYHYIQGIDQGSSPFLLLLAAILIGGGAVVLIRLSRSVMYVKGKIMKLGAKTSEEKGFATLLKKNNDLTHQWKKTAVLREKLHMMQLSAEEKTPD